MIVCPDCGNKLEPDKYICVECDYAPVLIDGFMAWSPDLAIQDSGNFFNPESFGQLAELESDNFWFKSRNKLIVWAINKYCGKPMNFAEIGCGTGFVLSAIARYFPDTHLTGTEIYTRGLLLAKNRVPSAKLMQLDARLIPFKNEFDIVGIFDVLEHIEEDETVLECIHGALTAGGHIILTVPQHAWLWSWTDDEARHVRRYAKQDLHNKLKNTGFTIVRSTSFVTFLMPLMVAARLAKKNRPIDPCAELRIPEWINCLLEWIQKLDFILIRANINLPMGGSRIIVAKKESVANDPI